MKRSNVIRTPSNAELEKFFEPYGVELGKLVYAWNVLQESLCGVFSLVAPPSHIAEAVWHSTQNDRTQREMLKRRPRRYAEQVRSPILRDCRKMSSGS